MKIIFIVIIMLILYFLLSFFVNYILDKTIPILYIKKLIFHIMETIYLLIFYPYLYFYTTEQHFVVAALDPLLYGWILGYYVRDMFTCTHRTGLMVHHIATIILMSMSYSKWLINFGIAVLLNYCIDDVFMNLARVTHVLGNKKQNKFWLGVTIFTWFWHRIIKSFHIMYEIVSYSEGYSVTEFLLLCLSKDIHLLFVALLFVLWIINTVYWFQIVYTFLKKDKIKIH